MNESRKRQKEKKEEKFLHKMSLEADKELFLWRAFKYSKSGGA